MVKCLFNRAEKNNLAMKQKHLTTNALRQQLYKIKNRDSTKEVSKVVYAIDCSCGKKYMGETKRTLNTRLSEHQAAARRGELAIAEHAWTEGHKLNWESAKIMDRADHNFD